MTKGRIHIFRGADKEYRWHFRARNGRIIADSGEGYGALDDCLTIASELHPGVQIVLDQDDTEVTLVEADE